MIGEGSPANVRGESAVEQIVLQAPAKVNLHLELLGMRPDGYHEIETVMLAVDLCDELELVAAPAGQLRLSCDHPELSCGPENLVWRAAQKLMARTGQSVGARIHLVKRIPWAAGLGGGSSDAAAALLGLNQLWCLGLTKADLAELGAELGSDIPFFFKAPAAICRGRGERVENIPVAHRFVFVLVKPPMGLTTAAVYQRYRQQDAADPPCKPDRLVAALQAGDVATVGACLHNRLQASAMELCPPILEIYRRLHTAHCAGYLMSGSGSCLFALCHDTREAQHVVDDVRAWLSPISELDQTRVELVRSIL